MRLGTLGKLYEDGECIVRQGDSGDCMYVLQQGRVEVVMEGARGEILLGILEPGDVFGEMAVFTKSPRSATVRARGRSRALTIDKKGFLKRIHEDPSLALRILQKMSERIQKLDAEVARLQQ